MALMMSRKKSGGDVNAQTISGSISVPYNTATDIDLSSYDFNKIVGVVLSITPTGYDQSLCVSLDNNDTVSEVAYKGNYSGTLTRNVAVDNSAKKVTLTIGLAGSGGPTNSVTYHIEVA